MLYNLRSDIIYYKSSSDFELEFNLCGCCRMRLLTDKPSNKKAFVHSLARAVSRSRVILIAGPIFGEENTIEIVSQALAATTEVVDNAAYGISSDDEISIIKGALPLVSNDGSFGGCIIESGPQTMILLTDNKALRKNIMSTLIHPYIAELYTAELNQNKKADEETENDAQTEGTEGTLEETEIYVPSNEEEPVVTDTTAQEDTIVSDTEEELPLILSLDENTPEKDITEEDIFIDTDETIAEDYESDKDITIDDLIPSTPDLDEPIRDIDEKIDSGDIIMESDDYTKTDLSEEFHDEFNDLFTDKETPDRTPIIMDEEQFSEFNLFDDESEESDENNIVLANKKPKLHIATIIFTVILLLAIIVLAYTIFSVSTSQGVAPAEYIKEVWQTVFG